MKWFRIFLLLPCITLQAQETAGDPLLAQQRLAAVLRQATTEYDRGNFQDAAPGHHRIRSGEFSGRPGAP
jgi:hypothetical protein